MKYLLDTHTLIWSILDIEKLSPEVRNIIENPKNEIFVSGISFWEIAIKAQLGKFNFGGINIILIPNIAKDYGFNIISPDSYDFITYGELTQVEDHKDTFDRIVSGRLSFHRAFMTGDMTAKGNLKILKMFDEIFSF